MSGKRTDGIRSMDDLRGRCRIDEVTGCWVWAGSLTASGSPSLWIPAIGGSGSIGTMLSLLTTGKRPKKGTGWVAGCMNPHCARVDPEHRRVATFSTIQKVTRPTLTALHKARISQGKRRVSKFYTPELALEIRTSTESCASIAARTGMAYSGVARIRRGETWAELSPFSQLAA